MQKVISFEEYQKFWDKDRKNAVLNYGEQYEVKYEFQGDDGFWKKNTILFCSCGKDNHDDVISEFRNRFPKAHLISVTYQ